MVSCRICKGDHWTTKCPYKDTLVPLQESLNQGGAATPPNESVDGAGASRGGGAGTSDRYVPPSLRSGTGQRKEGESMRSRG